jgi:hypothetical protein
MFNPKPLGPSGSTSAGKPSQGPGLDRSDRATSPSSRLSSRLSGSRTDSSTPETSSAPTASLDPSSSPRLSLSISDEADASRPSEVHPSVRLTGDVEAQRITVDAFNFPADRTGAEMVADMLLDAAVCIFNELGHGIDAGMMDAARPRTPRFNPRAR